MQSHKTVKKGAVFIRALLCALTYGLFVPVLWGLVCSDTKAGGGTPRRVAVVVGENAGEMERHAASELCGYLEKLYRIHAQPVGKPISPVDVTLLIGSPATNQEVARALGKDGWPQVSDQGIVLKRVRVNGKPALVIGGGSPSATLWAVYELVERWGVRYLLRGDMLPANPGHLALPPSDVVEEPIYKVRQMPLINDFALTTSSWGMADFRAFIDQLAKLKFNGIYSHLGTWQPFVPLDVDGISRDWACLWFCWHYPITDDMPGRYLFGDSKEFWNPDLPLGGSYEALQAAGEKLLHSLMAYAHSRGMKCALVASPTEFPPEFKPVLKGAVPIHQLEELEIVPGAKTPVDDPGLTKLSIAVVQTTVNTYPEADSLVIWQPEFRQWTEIYEKAWKALDAKYRITERLRLEEILPPEQRNSKAREVDELKGDIVSLYYYDHLFRDLNILQETRRPNVTLIMGPPNPKLYAILPLVYPPGAEAIIGGFYTASNAVSHREALRQVPAREIPARMVYNLNDDGIGVVPQLNTTPLYELTQELQRDGWVGFRAMYYLSGDLDPAVAYVARAAWDRTATPESVDSDLIQAVCGKACVPDLLEAFREVEGVTRNMQGEAESLSFPIPDMISKFMKPGPMPPGFAQLREGYRRALSAAQRAALKAEAGRNSYANYWVGRLKFAVDYFDCIEAVKRAASAESEAKKARAGNDLASAALKQAEAAKYAQQALDTARSMIETYAHVAADRSDLGAIATMDEYIYRPLKRWAGQLKVN